MYIYIISAYCAIAYPYKVSAILDELSLSAFNFSTLISFRNIKNFKLHLKKV